MIWAGKPPRILVAIASYGHGNDQYLARVVKEYRSMSCPVDIVLVSNVEKFASTGVECVVGLPTTDPWSLPFAHKRIFADRLQDYDLFIYSEDDILITERNILAFLEVNPALKAGEVAGFFRVEYGPNGEASYPEVHGHFRWDCSSVRTRGNDVLAQFTNEHSACYMLTRQQLADALASGGFLVEPHEGKYDLLCTAATDPYTQCGFKKLVPVSRIDEFLVHHLPNKYIGKFGVDRHELDAQIAELSRIAELEQKPMPLFSTETRLWHAEYSKDFYEPIVEEIVSAIPRDANILSIGAGSAANERRMAEAGSRVVVIPIDPVIGSSPARHGIEVVQGNLAAARATIKSEKFDCLLYLNVLQYVREPPELLTLFLDLLVSGGTVVMSTPNLPYLRYLWHSKPGDRARFKWRDFETTGVHNTSSGRVRAWCRRSGLKVEKILRLMPEGRGETAKSAWWPVPAEDLVVVARKS